MANQIILCVPHLFQECKVPEKQIMERSGHLSKEGVRSYERTSTEQIQSICKTLVAPLHDSKEKLPELLGPSREKLPELPGPPNTNEALKQLNFQGMSGCTFNINLNYSK